MHNFNTFPFNIYKNSFKVKAQKILTPKNLKNFQGHSRNHFHFQCLQILGLCLQTFVVCLQTLANVYKTFVQGQT